MKGQTLNFEDIQDEHLDAMIRLAFKQMDAIEAQELIAESESDKYQNEELADETYNAFMAKRDMLVKKTARKNRSEHLRRALPKIVQAAACLVLVICLAAPFAIANVKALRVKVMRLLFEFDDGHVEISLGESVGEEMDIPPDWLGNYYPTYIPEGFEIKKISELSSKISYFDKNGLEISFEELDASAAVGLNTENGTITYENVNGNMALVIVVDDLTTVTWSEGYEYFIVDSQLGKEETLKIARSIRKIS